MMYKDYFLKFKDEAEWLSVCDVEGVSFDVIGDLSTDGHRVDGWHVNARSSGIFPETLISFCIGRPKEPKRVWA